MYIYIYILLHIDFLRVPYFPTRNVGDVSLIFFLHKLESFCWLQFLSYIYIPASERSTCAEGHGDRKCQVGSQADQRLAEQKRLEIRPSVRTPFCGEEDRP